MTLEGAINLNETNDYTIYTMNSVTTGQYGVVVPKNVSGTMNMLIDLHMKSSFDGVGSGAKTREQLVSEISDEYNKLKSKYTDGMLVMPMIDEVVFQLAVNNADKQKMFDEVKKIGAITSELYKKLTDQGVDKQKIDQKIIIVKKTVEDDKFVEWLKEQMPNFVDGVAYSELTVQTATNPFMDSNSIFGPAPEVKVETASSSIFDSVAPSVTEQPTTVVAPVTPVVEAQPAPAVDLFGNTAAQQVQSAPVTPVVETQPAPAVDLFGNAVAQQVQSVPTVESQPMPAPVVETPVVATEGPKPVESAVLDGTMTFSPVTEQTSAPVEEVENGVEENVTNKGSKGFVNLIILLVVLVAVTVVSIELGKYLYGVYGA